MDDADYKIVRDGIEKAYKFFKAVLSLMYYVAIIVAILFAFFI